MPTKRPLALRLLWVLSLILILAALAMMWFYAPMERTMGVVQKIFYFHVAANWLGMLSFAVAAVMAILHLATRNPRWIHLEVAAVEIGWAFSLIGVISGSIWARPIWNTWWTADPRLNTVAIMVLLYTAYLVLRQVMEEPEKRDRFSSVYAIIAFVTVPLAFLSARLYRTIHPTVIGSSSSVASGGFAMAPAMRTTMFFALFAFTVLYVTLLWERYRLEVAYQELAKAKSEL
ncbi:MAG: cytochrome c biogenesis protein CcsA [Chloroflexi bacterium]|nr:cytochrome c biogenesis protein CcsA [Chloroflexota bacterium]